MLDAEDIKLLKNELPEKWKLLNKKLAYAYDKFEKVEAYGLGITSLRKHYFSKLKNDYPDHKEIERAYDFINSLNIKNGKNYHAYIQKVM